MGRLPMRTCSGNPTKYRFDISGGQRFGLRFPASQENELSATQGGGRNTERRKTTTLTSQIRTLPRNQSGVFIHRQLYIAGSGSCRATVLALTTGQRKGLAIWPDPSHVPPILVVTL